MRYQSLLGERRDIPAWIDAALRKAVQPDPYRRYEELSEFIHDLRHPNQALLNEESPPLIDRDPLFFWKCVSFILTIIIALLLLFK